MTRVAGFAPVSKEGPHSLEMAIEVIGLVATMHGRRSRGLGGTPWS